MGDERVAMGDERVAMGDGQLATGDGQLATGFPLATIAVWAATDRAASDCVRTNM